MNPAEEKKEVIENPTSVAQKRVSEVFERDDSVILLDDLNKALVGSFLNENGNVVAVYAEELCLALVIERLKEECPDLSMEELREDAADYLSDLGRAAPYMRGAAPVIIEGFDFDSDVWRCFLED